MFGFNWLIKRNPAQEDIVSDYGVDNAPSVKLASNKSAYSKLEIVSRGVNLIVDSAAEIDMDVGDSLPNMTTDIRVRHARLERMLNFRPNMYYNSDVLRRSIIMDLILEGDAFIYYDGANMFHLPALSVELVADEFTYIKEYKYGTKTFTPDEIIHIKDNSAASVFVGTSRLDSATASMELLLSMTEFQTNFFDNSAVPGIILTTPNSLSDRVKKKMISSWVSNYNPRKGGKKPMIIDGDFKLESISKHSFKELDFNDSIGVQEGKVLKALGVPPVLLDAGNNANINPNLRMFYIQTVMPLYNKYIKSLEMYFGYDIKPVTQNVLALTPELRDLSNYYSTLANAGIITRNEAREELRYSKHEENEDAPMADSLILPANIAGSAVDSTVGGAPSEGQD